jgi:hypothetical protein
VPDEIRNGRVIDQFSAKREVRVRLPQDWNRIPTLQMEGGAVAGFPPRCYDEGTCAGLGQPFPRDHFLRR